MAQLRGHIAGFVEAPEDFLPGLQAAFPGMRTWPRLIKQLKKAPPPLPTTGSQVQPITDEDAGVLAGLSAEIEWISKTWGGPDGLAASGYAWGAFEEDRIVSVACTFFLGEQFEDIGVVTEPEYRGRGLAAACAAALCRDIQDRGRIPSWTTSPGNEVSLRLVARMGFEFHREDSLYVIDRPVPGSVPLG
jgi:RimJ/RimL family protein N-acetyltransferase